MAYIDYHYYDSEFHGSPIPPNEFDRLVDIASDVIRDVAVQQITPEHEANPCFKKAIAYQVEYLFTQGGIDAITGFASSATSESLGGYSISVSSDASKSMKSKGGIPVSTLAIAKLREIGLMNRCVYQRRRRYGE